MNRSLDGQKVRSNWCSQSLSIEYYMLIRVYPKSFKALHYRPRRSLLMIKNGATRMRVDKHIPHLFPLCFALSYFNHHFTDVFLTFQVRKSLFSLIPREDRVYHWLQIVGFKDPYHVLKSTLQWTSYPWCAKGYLLSNWTNTYTTKHCCFPEAAHSNVSCHFALTE